MFVKMIAFRDVRPGDMVSENVDCGWYEIGRCAHTGDGGVLLSIVGGGSLKAPAGQLIGLFHRPWPEGKTERDMLDVIGRISRGLGLAIFDRGWEIDRGRENMESCQHLQQKVNEWMPQLREAIEAYELGKPVPGKKVGSRWEPVSTGPDLTAGGC